MRAPWLLRSLVGAVTVAVCACSNPPIIPDTPAMQRPGRIAFACLRIVAGQPPQAVSLEMCKPADPVIAGSPYHLHALVTQTARGEILAVDLLEERILDGDPRVPGFTALAVGDLPTDVVVPANVPPGGVLNAYVASEGSRDIRRFPVVAMRGGGVSTFDTRAGSVSLPGAPVDLELIANEQAIVAAIPDRGAIAVIPLNGSELGSPTLVPLSDTYAPGVSASAATPTWERICATSGPPPVPTTVEPRTVPGVMGPRPGAMVVDAERSVLLVADERLPVVHVIEITATGLGAELAPINVGAALSAIALSPAVPRSATDRTTTRYLYALDREDGGVLVVDYDSASPTFGAVLPVSPGATPDRIQFDARAVSIGVFTPSYSAANIIECDPGAPRTVGPRVLRGAFLAVGLADGSIRVVDIFDADAPCRGTSCTPSIVLTSDERVLIRRHRPRIGAILRAPIKLTNAPSVAVDGAANTVGTNGITAMSGAPDLVPIQCGATETQVYPAFDTELPPLVCLANDPWNTFVESWFVRYEGAFARGDVARLSVESGVFTAAPEQDVCAAGVLGDDGIRALLSRNDGTALSAPERGYARGDDPLGDQLVITAEVLPGLTGETATRCARLTARDIRQRRLPIAFPILEASRDRLVLGPLLGRPDLFEDERNPVAIVSCFRDHVEYEVRTRGTFAVVSSRVGYLHRVGATASGRCEVDLTQSALRVGRAVAGVTYSNGATSFQIKETPPNAESIVELTFTLADPPPQVFSASASSSGGFETLRLGLPKTLAFEAMSRRLFAVDAVSRGLVIINPETFQPIRTFQ